MIRPSLTTVMAVAVIAGGGLYLSRGAAPSESIIPAALAQDTAEAVEIVDMVQGNPDAPVELIEYASYTCGHCANFHAEQYKQLKADYIDTGKIRFVYREIYFDRAGLWASMVARCGGEMRFFGISDMVYTQRDEWIGDGDLAAISERLQGLGKAAGLTQEQLDVCMADGAKAQSLVNWSQANMESHNVQGTPTLVLNGETKSNMSYSELSKLLDEALAKAE